MVGLIIEEQYIPLYSSKLKDSPKFVRSQELAAAARNTTIKDGKVVEAGKGVISGIAGLIKSIKGDDNHSLAEVEALLDKNKILSLKWRSGKVVTIVTSDGTIVHFILKNLQTQEIAFSIDKSLRHQNDVITNVAYAHGVVLFLFEDNRLLIGRTFERDEASAKKDPVQAEVTIDVFAEIIPGLAHKKKKKDMLINDTRDKFVIYWTASKDDVFPWSPNPRDRANVLVYQLQKDEEPEIVSYLKSDNQLLDIAFVPNKDMLSILEQEVDAEGNILLVEYLYEVSTMTRESETAIPVQSEVTCFAYDFRRSRLAIGCRNSSVVIYAQDGNVTLFTKTPFVPNAVSWHPDGHIFVVASSKGEYQVFDIALSPMLLLEDFETEASVIKEFVTRGAIAEMVWSPWFTSSADSNLLVRFESGVFVMLRFAVAKMGLVELVNYYLISGETAEAIKALKSVYWSSEDCLVAMLNIYSRLIRCSHTVTVETELETLLAVFFVPAHGGDENTRLRHIYTMRTLARRFFMWLLRAGKCERALQVAESLGEEGLFKKLNQVALVNGDTVTAQAAMDSITPDSDGSETANESYSEDESTASGSGSETESEYSESYSESCSSCHSGSSISSGVTRSSNGYSSEDVSSDVSNANKHQVVISNPAVAVPGTSLRVLPLETEFDDAVVLPMQPLQRYSESYTEDSSDKSQPEPKRSLLPSSSELQSILSRNINRTIAAHENNTSRRISPSDIQIVHFGEV